MTNRSVVNASPLIFFARSARLDLLHAVAGDLLVPETVVAEIRARGEDDPTAKSLRSAEWICAVQAPEIPRVILDWNLGNGESAVLAIAYSSPGMLAIIDDLTARKCALALGVPVRGTLGVVLAAKNRGIIGSARQVPEEMLQSGLYLSRHVLDEALKCVGE